MGDENRYMQIMLNFLSNALKFTGDFGQVTVQVILQEIQQLQLDSLLYETDPSKIEKEQYAKFQIKIIDNGVGITPENKGKIFMDFSKLEEHADKNPTGTGLGLSICKQLIEQMGGAVRVDSVLG